MNAYRAVNKFFAPPRTAILTLLLFSCPVWAAFEDTGVGARAPGMADAFVAVADDANALFYNPAGLGQLTEGELYSEYGLPESGTNNDNSTASTGYAALAQPLKEGLWGTLGAYYNSYQVTNLYDEHTIALGYGVKLGLPFLPDSNQWLVGASAKQLHVGFDSSAISASGLNNAGFSTGQPNPLFANYGYSSNAYAFDAGTLYKFGESRQYNLGLDLANFNRPDVSLSGAGDPAPFFTRLGASWNSPWALFTIEGRRIQYLTDLTDYEGALGVERFFSLGHCGSFAVRGGYAQGSRQYQIATMGVSYQLSFLQFDYAFFFPIGNLTDSDLGYSVGLSFKWRGRKAAPKEEEAAENHLPSFETAAQPALSTSRKPPTKIELQAQLMRQALREQAKTAEMEVESLEKLVKTRQILPIHFDFDDVVLLPDSFPIMDRVIEIVKRYPALRIQVSGFTDATGPGNHNLELSQQRAEAVKDYLVKQGGLFPEWIAAVGYGSARPIASNEQEEGRTQNRRVEFRFFVINPETYIIRPGDTLKSIARKLYGNEGLEEEIYQINEEKLRNLKYLPEGLVLELPKGGQ